MVSYTQNLKLPKPNFDSNPWHSDLLSALDSIDSIIYSALVVNNTAAWAQNTLYGIGVGAIDTSNGLVYINLVQHTSANSGTFADERAAHPTYWTGLTAGVTPRGAWAHDTTYAINDTVYDTVQGVMALCIVAHTSNHSGTIRTDSANWAFIFDFSTIGSSTALGVAFTPAGNIIASNVQTAIEEVDNEKLAKALNLSDLADASIARSNLSLAAVAHSGSYADLTSTPTLGTAASKDVGTTANKIVQLDASAKLPAVDGSQLTNLGGGFAAGTAMLFQQTSAPTGWTKSTTHNNKALRLVSGTVSSGGTMDFTTAFTSRTSDATTLSSGQVPAHTHSLTGSNGETGSTVQPKITLNGVSDNSASTSSVGGGGSHTHTFDISVKYVDCIIATKD